MKQKLFFAGSCLFALILGIVIGCAWGNIPFFTLDPQINLLDVLGFLLSLVSLTVTVFIAVNVTKILQSNQAITSYLASELGELIDLVRIVHKVIADAYSSGSFTPEKRDALMFAFYKMELKLGSFEIQLMAAFPKAGGLVETLKRACFEYKNYLTDGELMLSSCNQVSALCYKDCETQHSKVETAIKTALQKMHRL